VTSTTVTSAFAGGRDRRSAKSAFVRTDRDRTTDDDLQVRPTVLVHAPDALERVAVQTILSAHRRFAVVFGTGHGSQGRFTARPPDVLVWVGEPRSARPAIRPAMQAKTLIVLRDIAAASAVMSLRQGARGLTCLSCHLDQLAHAVESISTGQGWLAPCLAKVVADHLAGRARLRASDSFGLTARELLVLRSIASGAANEEVAMRLGIDVRTVKFHASNIYRKLGARHRAEAVAIAYQLGLAA
jgi:DNA-binding NarL/FixJ family response regulator